MPQDVALIGFAGAPWTVLSYMIAGQGTPDQGPAHALMRNDPKAFRLLLNRVTEATILYLDRQIEAGAEAVKIFDSWAATLPDPWFTLASVEPCRQITAALKSRWPNVPVIGFPRGVGLRTERFVRDTGMDGVAIGQDVDPRWARDVLQPLATVQGNLDPGLMIEGGAPMERAATDLIGILGNGPFIFNLGHGITPDADPHAVERLVALVRG